MTDSRSNDKHAPAKLSARPPRRRTAFGRVIARVFPALTFDEPFETQFRRWYATYVRARIRNALWIPLCCLLIAMLGVGPIGSMRMEILGADQQSFIDILRFAVILPSCLAMLAAVKGLSPVSR